MAILLARATRMMLVLAALTGLCFPAVVTGLAQLLWPAQAGGSLVGTNGRLVGSELIGQPFSRPEYFHPRPSAAAYDAAASAATNLGPTSAKLVLGEPGFDGVAQLAAAYRQTNELPPGTLVPADAVTRSASGLDPHISVANARLQASRVARSRRLPEHTVAALVSRCTEPRSWGILGEPRVNVLRLNLALDRALAEGQR